MVDDAVAPTPTAPIAPLREDAAAAVARFRSCRWHAGQDGTAEYCSHPEVQPYAGRKGFNAVSWCPECAFYKARRNARRRDADFDY